jgi:Acyl-CoA dehydrogenases
MINFEFSEEQKLFQEVVRDFAEKEIAPLVDKYEREKDFLCSFFPNWVRWDFSE